ncbi:acyltransferase family protein [Azotobacter vinelandii]|uniref:acyltransferase family protein n=1 Tax=Azotobacter vinelandii TaxID=354 RepID=UPI0026668AA5|nr:acyltransferase family protein [Azotobacter vinelandii]WKN23755.1 acyltransferase [Azotobacter vinelandii]
MKLQAVKFGDGFTRWLRRDARPPTARELSQAIGFARITLIVGLVFLHYMRYPNSQVSPFDGMDVAHHPLATFVNSFVLFFFFSAVPLLSLISGWLFFSFAARPHAARFELQRRIRRRLRSLYLPLVFWNAVFLAILLSLFLWRASDPLPGVLNIRFERAGWFDYLNAVFGLTRHPVGFQFWFVRDLFVTVLISPLLWLLLRHAPYLGLAILGPAWLAGHDLLIFFRSDVVFFFYLGGWLRIGGVSLEVGRRAALTLVLAYVVLVALRAAAPLLLGWDDQRPEWLSVATRAMRPIGVLACWGMVLQLAATPAGAVVARYGGLAFFLYAMHFPLIAEVKIQLWRLVPAPTDGWMLAHYLASVLVTVAIALCAGSLLAYKAPRCFALMNGGRALDAGNSRAEPATRPAAAVLERKRD